MGVWGRIRDPDWLATMMRHPAQTVVTSHVADLITAVRAAGERSELRAVQAQLFDTLLAAEQRYQEARRAVKRGETPPENLDYWRRACRQLRSVGDALAWRFLGYRRQWVAFMGRNQHPGMMLGKAGTWDEWAAANGHWDEGRPALMTALTNCITITDLLVQDGETLWTIEVKRDPNRKDRAQMDRLRDLQRQLMETPRLRGPDGAWVLESSVPLDSFWSRAEMHLDRALRVGVVSWVPTRGVAVFLTAPRYAHADSREHIDARFAATSVAAGIQMGPMSHRLRIHSVEYPYRQSHAAPMTIFPVRSDLAARLVTGEIVFTIEVSVDVMVAALGDQGFEARIVLPDEDGELESGTPVIAVRRGDMRGIVHGGAIEQLGTELTPPSVWASALADLSDKAPSDERRASVYVCYADEERVWQPEAVADSA
jgi:hypothetical protein